MKKKIVLGILSDSITAITTVNNLSEADFDDKDVSVVMLDKTLKQTMAVSTGPLRGVTLQNIEEKLQSIGVSNEQSNMLRQSILQKKALIAIAVDDGTVEPAKEMLGDYNPGGLIVI